MPWSPSLWKYRASTMGLNLLVYCNSVRENVGWCRWPALIAITPGVLRRQVLQSCAAVVYICTLPPYLQMQLHTGSVWEKGVGPHWRSGMDVNRTLYSSEIEKKVFSWYLSADFPVPKCPSDLNKVVKIDRVTLWYFWHSILLRQKHYVLQHLFIKCYDFISYVSTCV